MTAFTVGNVALGLAGAYLLTAPNPLQTLPHRIKAVPQQAFALPAVLDKFIFNQLQQLLLYIGSSIVLALLSLLQPKTADMGKRASAKVDELDTSDSQLICYPAVDVPQHALIQTVVPAPKQQRSPCILPTDLFVRVKKPYFGPLAPPVRETVITTPPIFDRRNVNNGLHVATDHIEISIPRAPDTGSSACTKYTDSDTESTSTAPTSPTTSEPAEDDDHPTHWYANTRCYENGDLSLIYDPAACTNVTEKPRNALIVVAPRVASASGLILKDVSPDTVSLPGTSLAVYGEVQIPDFVSISFGSKLVVPSCLPWSIEVTESSPPSATIWEQHTKCLPTSSASTSCVAFSSTETHARSNEDTDKSVSAVSFCNTDLDVRSTPSPESLEKSSLSDEDDDERAPASPYYDAHPNVISTSPLLFTTFFTDLQKNYETQKTQLLAKKERVYLKSVAKTRKKRGRAAKGLTKQVVAWTVNNRVRVVSADEDVKLWAAAQLETEKEWECKSTATIELAIVPPLPPISNALETDISDALEVEVAQAEHNGQDAYLEEQEGPFTIDRYSFTTLLQRTAGMSRPELYIFVARLLLYATLSPYMSEDDEVRSRSLLHFIDFATSCSVGTTLSATDSEDAKFVVNFWVRRINYVLQRNTSDPKRENLSQGDLKDYLSILPMLLRIQGNHEKARLVSFAQYSVSPSLIRGLSYYAAQIYLSRLGRLESDARMYEEFLAHVGYKNGTANEDLITLMTLSDEGLADFTRTFDDWYQKSFYGGHGHETEPYQDDELLSSADLFYGGCDTDTESWDSTPPLSDAAHIRTKYAILNIHNRYDFAAWQIYYLMLVLDQVLQGYRVWFETTRHGMTSEMEKLAAEKIEEIKTQFGTRLRMRAESITKMDRVIEQSFDDAHQRDRTHTQNLQLGFQVPPAADVAYEKVAAQLFTSLPSDAQQRLNEISLGLWDAYETHEDQLENQVSAIESQYSKIFVGPLNDNWSFDDILALNDNWDQSTYRTKLVQTQSERTSMLSRCFDHYYQHLQNEVDAVTVMSRTATSPSFPNPHASMTSRLSVLVSQSSTETWALPKKQTARSRFFKDGLALQPCPTL